MVHFETCFERPKNQKAVSARSAGTAFKKSSGTAFQRVPAQCNHSVLAGTLSTGPLRMVRPGELRGADATTQQIACCHAGD